MTRHHPSAQRRGLLGFLAVLLLTSACGSTQDTVAGAGTTDEATPTAESQSPVAPNDAAQVGDTGMIDGIEAAQWSDNVEITIGDGTFRYVSNGIPSHELPDQFLIPNDGNMPPFDGDDIETEFHIADTDELILESPVDVEITLDPVYSEEITETGLGTIGVMISGAQLFNDYEDQSREFVALDDNLTLDGVFFIDACNGHPLASGSDYHYHGVPYCITDDVDVAGAHSTIIGVLLDGFGVYGPQDVDGSILTNDDLDECSGHVGTTPEFADGIYHYHLTEDTSPYSIDCFHGEIDDAGTDGAGGPGGPGAVNSVNADELAERAEVMLAALWADNVTITITGQTATFASDGLPAHEYLDTYLADGRDGKYIADGVEAYDARFDFPVVPTMADSPSETGNGAIGVAISGAVFFDPYEGNGSNTVANDDNESIDGIPFIDACGGHPLPNAVSYHYHGIPFCITDAIDTPGAHSKLIGYLFDGHGIYGPQDSGGAEPVDLDSCLGHTGPTPEFAGDTYHYHVVSTANYISECLVGVSPAGGR